ncbi:hypothetical protein B0T21DRAFT_360589 [Apiosordaria backusii]|uniref:Uncharacterized protein n=1 Tax=Apiosordaria backusii TaxID=314023 RepID=A0AA40K165_9PEZI|nr:hypothetical protein B0T21DRAFT_360589 [Apiosordaria backusii]
MPCRHPHIVDYLSSISCCHWLADVGEIRSAVIGLRTSRRLRKEQNGPAAMLTAGCSHVPGLVNFNLPFSFGIYLTSFLLEPFLSCTFLRGPSSGSVDLRSDLSSSPQIFNTPLRTIDSAKRPYEMLKRRKAISQIYENVHVLVISWKDGSHDFKREGEAVGRMFSDHFRYDVSYFDIPSSSSELHLLMAIAGCLVKIGEPSETSLFIIHYGGHADPNDNKNNGEERESIWTA